ncbi:MAG: M50 family peptidase [Acidobacteria bacterium]|nr:MAG: M50 family peptidase [Acidobacteriota bacterium]REK02497.1 MAG: M50 family peptidase [Acidobacteriota bacterium]REK13701.1 MAG: M50 family peptidase [Acidobacteriota bacterium]REK41695.1 MAG: M50 family peptidase [Acidobacteriota bacterium]
MNYKIADDVKPQAKLLIIATIISVLIFVASFFIPLLGYVVYPLQLFATFIHEGSHVLATVMTGGSVQSLTVSPDTSGVVWSLTQDGNWLQRLIISSAGYLGTTAFGVALLAWFRYGFSSRKALYFASGFVGLMTLVFGLLAPIWNVFSAKVGIASVAFTVLSGAALTAGLFAIARYAQLKWSNFALAFLAVQCLLNSIFSLKNLFLISATTSSHSDAMNMAEATGIPAIAWVLIWIIGSVVMISIGLRLYAVSANSGKHDLPFEDQ